MALAILIVLAISHSLGKIEIGISLTMGMFISAPANFPGSNRHRINGMLAAIILGVAITLIINLVDESLWLLTPVMGILIFLVSYLSVFGFRASLVSFSGLSAIARITLATLFCISGFDRWIAFNSMALLNSPVFTEDTAPPPIPIR